MGVGRYALLFLLMVSIVSAADASLFDTAVDSVTTFFDWVMGGITGLAIDDGSVSTASACGYVNGDLTLTNNLFSNTTCLTVNASNIVIDCNGHSIVGNYSLNGAADHYGIVVFPYSNLSIRNCNISNYYKGIGSAGGAPPENVSFSNNTFYDNMFGIRLTFGDNITVRSNLFVRNLWGFLQTYGDNLVVSNNTFFNHTNDAITLNYVANVNVYNNSINMSLYGVEFDNTNGSITLNDIFNSDAGIRLVSDSEATIASNNISANTEGVYGASNSILHVFNNYFNNSNYDIWNSNLSSTFNTTNTTGTNIIGGPYMGGNFYASYAGVDSDGDGIGDTPFNDSGRMAVPDYLPLMYPPVSCGYVNSDVTLTNNVSANGTCFTVNTSNVVIDCNGYSITGNGTLYGVRSPAHSNVTVQNCVISDYAKATYLTSGSDHTVRDNTLFELDRGVEIVGGFNHVVVNNSIFNTTYAVHLDTNDSDIVNNTLFNNSEYGLRLFSSGTILVDGNEFILNTQGGVHLYNSENTVTSNNIFRNNLHRGINVEGFSTHTITGNNISGSIQGILGQTGAVVYNNYFNNTIDINSSQLTARHNTTKTSSTNIIGGSYLGGNYYASYAGVDSDGDGIGDTPFNDSGNMAVPDYLPLLYSGGAVSCGYVNSDVTLTNNVSANGTCFTVNASDIVIDCDGYSITGNGTGDGVYSRYYDNVTIRNCVIEDFASGIDVRDGVNVSILNNTVVNSSSQALYTSMIDNAIVASNNFLLETVYIKNTNGTVEYNVFNDSDVTLSTSDINFSFNNVSDNVWGLTVLSADSVRIFNNTFRDNSFSAIKLSQIQNDRAFVSDNYFDQNSYGVYLDRINASHISNNTFVNFNPYAVYCTPLSSAYNLANEIRGNTIANSTYQGIHVSGCNDTIIIGNTITNTSVGINASVKKIVVYDNYFNNTVDISNTNSSSQFNTTKTPGINIIGGPYIGGNFYASYAGVDGNGDGLGDTPFNDSGNMAIPDFLPLMYGGSAPASSCGYVNTNLTLTNNLSSSGTCLTANASNIVIDCDGYSITGDGTGEGVLSDYDNVTVQNCVITNFSTAVDVSHTMGNLIINNNLTHSAYYGVSGSDVMGMRLVGNSVFNSTRAGLYLDELTNIEITDNTLTNNTDGMELWAPLINIVIENNTVYNNLEDGVRVIGGVVELCDNVTVTSNVVYNNTFHGINIMHCDGSGNEISSNLVRDNVQHGVNLENSYNFSVTSNTIVRNGYYGLSMEGSADNQVLNNSIRNNTQGGIYATDVDNIIIGNTVVGHIIGINLTAEPAVVYNNYLNNTLDIFNTNVNSQFNTTQTAGMNIIGGPYIGGNYYASYNGTDTDGDGFGETPYNASGNMSVNDFLPLVPGAVYVPPTPSSGSSSSSGGGGGGGRSSSSSGSSGPVLTYLGDSSGSTTDSSTVDSSTTESSGLDTSISKSSTSETSTGSSTGRSDDSSESSRTESVDAQADRYAAPSIVTASLNAVRGMIAPVISTMKTNSILFQLVGAVALFSSILGIAHVVTRPTPVAVPVAKQVELQTVPVFIGETYMLSHETRLRKGEGEDVYVDYDIILDVHDHEHIYRRRFK